jgi:hypothetical protein
MAEVKPADLYVGVVELFSVALPGSLLTAGLLAMTPAKYAALLGPIPTKPEAFWVAFAFSAYVLGSFILPPASQIDRVYDKYREWRWKRERDLTFQWASVLRGRFFGEDAVPPMNTYAWAKSRLTLVAPIALNTVIRYEAESKFFRSLIVVALVLTVLGWWLGWPPHDPSIDPRVLPWATAIFIGFSFFSYVDRRYKSTEWAYRYVVTLQLDPPPRPAPAQEGA